MEIKDIISFDLLFKGKSDLSHEPLNGGFSNETHIVTCEGIKYVVKINFPQNKYLNLSRKTEGKAQAKAALLGIAPKVYSDFNEERYSISEFLEGHLLTNEEIRIKENIIQLADILKKIHSISGIDRVCSGFDLVEGYVQGIQKFDIKLPDGYIEILKETDRIRNRRSLDVTNNHRYCHNDALTLNILYHNGIMNVIDWELSGIGDPYMDLATIPYQLNFNEEEEKLLLTSYFGYYEEDMLYYLHDLRYIGMVREVVWAFFFAGLNLKSANHDFNYYNAGCHALERLKGGFLSL